MHKHILSFAIAVSACTGIIICGLCVVSPVAAEAPQASSVVISGVQVREAASDDSSNSYNEFIEIANNGSQITDITNWCLKYASASSPEKLKTIGCFLPKGDNGYVLLPAYGRAFAASSEYLSSHGQTDGYDFVLSVPLSNDAGYIKLFDGNNEMDGVSWGVDSDSVVGGGPVGSDVMRRVELGDGIFKQTGKSADDFELVSPAPFYASSAQYVFDLCLNIDSIQTEIPPGLSSDDKGNCSPPSIDVCLNIDGVQSALPQGDTADVAGNCYPVEDNPNGGQPTDDDNNTAPVEPVPVLPLELSEILANPSGVDTGHEFLEIYNPNQDVASLSDYQVFIGANLVPGLGSQEIQGGGYLILTNEQYDFTLVNTTSRVGLLLKGAVVDEASYANPREGWSWAKIDGLWQYTNQVTPGMVNLSSVTGSGGEALISGELQSCPAGQERNPETNRCRKIVTAAAEILASCPAGQYRNPATNRCKALVSASDAPVACGPGQERNPETNRCRKIVLAATEPAECPAGQERNPETNRCRKVSAMPSVDYAVAGARTEKAAGSQLAWLLIGGVVALCAGYAVFEWRFEIVKLGRRLWPWPRRSK